ncbi:chemotaxis protein CheW [Denitromonas ohlonensis]|uniref:Chemotaxis protein CheA n=2 Tax=Denitromonas TaxID=139331 RepID=A0A557RVA0_9RHOO|nr:chemotaxis protein CheW [Denitromonas ohlonensis]TVO69069.1 chemotaxis protein CheA [Denitromonas ohlonensis]TVO77169.1 chemotaxis protein CheA [Denitromonas ohlonensis]
MSIDMSQFYQVFFDEAAEHLGQIENLLVSIDLRHPDEEELNAVFRAAHSIKGSAATFGFSDMADITHVMESLLDEVRKGARALSADMVDACLAAGDILTAQLAGHRGEGEADPAQASAIVARLEQLLKAGNSPAPLVEASPAAETPAPAVAAPPAASSALTAGVFDVRFVPEPHVASQPELLDNMLDELGRLGGVEIVSRPAVDSDDPQWWLKITSMMPADMLRDVLDFMAEPGSVDISPVGGEPPAGEETAYGFFEPLPDALPQAAAEGEGAARAECVVVEEEAYGFFTEPGPAVESRLVEAEVSPESVAVAEAAMPAKSGGDTSIRVGVEKVDQMINLVGELVITQAMLAASAQGIDPVLYERLLAGINQLQRNTRDLQETVMSVRMLPISMVFSRFPRVVHDLSRKLDKRVELKLLGEHTELDKGLVERLADPLTHLVRNSLDHGIETPEQRRAAGKPETGIITLSASHQSGNIVIEVGDDGAGLDRARILAKAREKGLTAPDSLSDADVWMLIFEAGFSTAEVVTEVSGRGVGMDVVRRNISAMGGRVDVQSILGVGTRFTVRLPLTLAILDGMSVRVGGETYILPLGHVAESLQPTADMIHSISGVPRLIRLRGRYVPVIELYREFGVADGCADWTRGIMVVIDVDGSQAALFVDALLGQHQVVIKSLEANFRRIKGFSGATILGDGRVAMILDLPALASSARRLQSVAA